MPEVRGKAQPSTEVMMEALSKEYGWLPSSIKEQDYYDIMAYWKILTIKRRIEKAESKYKRKR